MCGVVVWSVVLRAETVEGTPIVASEVEEMEENWGLVSMTEWTSMSSHSVGSSRPVLSP